MKLFVVKKRSEKHIYAKQQNQNRPAIAWKKKVILLWKCIIFYNNLLNQSKKIFLVKQQTSLVETQLLGGVGEATVEGFLLTPWLISIKYPWHITLCGTNTVFEHTSYQNCLCFFKKKFKKVCTRRVNILQKNYYLPILDTLDMPRCFHQKL